MMSSLFFVRWRKKRKRMETVVALPMFMSSLVFTMDLSRKVILFDEARQSGRIGKGPYFYMVCPSGLWLDQVGLELGLDTSLSLQYVGGEAQGMLDDSSDPWVWLSALLLIVVASPASALSSSSELRAWHWYHHCLAGFSLQSETWSSVLAFSFEVLGFIAHAKILDCLFRSQLLDAVVDIVVESVSIFSFKKATNI